MKLLSFILFFTSVLAFSQKEYKFDYIITYQSNNLLDSSKSRTKQFLTNSKDNSYFAVITDKSNEENKLHFTDHYGLHFEVFFSKNELSEAKVINIKCDFVQSFFNDTEKLTKHYNYINLSSSKNKGVNNYDYKLESINIKRAKRKKLGTYSYTLEDNKSSHLPISISHLEYEEWKSKKNIPNGVFSKRVFTNYLGEITHEYILLKVEKTSKKIVIPSKCSL